MDQFNIFEAAGPYRDELRHSHFLAYLLDPQQPHGLRDLFLKRLLQVSIQKQAGQTDVTVLDVDVWDLDRAVVTREANAGGRGRMDVLVTDDANRLVFLIENKVDSPEQAGQLQVYQESIQEQYADWRKVAIYLTPTGSPPSDPRYITMTYRHVVEVMEGILDDPSSKVTDEVALLIRHYCQMVRRRVLNDSEIADLCRRLYRKHRRAIDLIYQNRPDIPAALYPLLLDLINETEGVGPDISSKPSYVRFYAAEWDAPGLRVCTNWTRSRRLLMFSIENKPTQVVLRLWVGEGPDEIRQKILDSVANSDWPFLKPEKDTSGGFRCLYERALLQVNADDDVGTSELEVRLRRAWEEFVSEDLPRITEGLKSREWDLPIPIVTSSTSVRADTAPSN